MSGKIEVGCWAVVYKPMPCCGAKGVTFGIPFIVLAIRKSQNGRCHHCDAVFYSIDVRQPSKWTPMEVCKRIDPPSESESRETKESLHA